MRLNTFKHLTGFRGEHGISRELVLELEQRRLGELAGLAVADEDGGRGQQSAGAARQPAAAGTVRLRSANARRLRRRGRLRALPAHAVPPAGGVEGQGVLPGSVRQRLQEQEAR